MSRQKRLSGHFEIGSDTDSKGPAFAALIVSLTKEVKGQCPL